MASPIPCAVCGQVADADWLVTARTEVTDMPVGTTFGVCMDCWIGMALAKLQQVAGVDLAPDGDPETALMILGLDNPESVPLTGDEPTVEPGVLEMIEMDETRPAEQERPARGRKSRPPAEVNGGPAVEEEAASADVER